MIKRRRVSWTGAPTMGDVRLPIDFSQISREGFVSFVRRSGNSVHLLASSLAFIFRRWDYSDSYGGLCGRRVVAQDDKALRQLQLNGTIANATIA